jgi:DNA polymerase
MTTLHIDFETRSTVELKTAGLDNYARSPGTDVWCMAGAFDDSAVSIWTNRPETKTPTHVMDFVRRGGTVVAHNAQFELAIWNHIMVPRYGWPALKPEQVRCTMAMCYAMSLPGALDNAAAAVGLQHRKDAAGYRLMIQMSKPREIKPDGTVVWWDEPEKLQKLYAYCKQDVVVERELEKRIMPLSAAEQALWVLDQKINTRGVYVDRPTARKAVAVVTAEQDRLNTKMREVTGNFVGFCTENARITKWVNSRGVATEGIAKADVVGLLEQPGLPDDVRAALLLRQEAGKSSNAKLNAMIEATGPLERLCYMFQYHAASTGRWGGRRVQLQNLPRWPDDFDEDSADDVIDALMTRTPQQAAQYIRLMYDSPMTVMSYLLRSLLRAAPGHDLIAADFASIESRGLAWLAGEEWKLGAFREYDEGRGTEMYKLMAAMVLGKKPEDVTKDERQAVGKVPELACGYGGGVGAFQSMAKVYGLKLPDEKADEIKVMWRDKNPRIKQYWYDCEDAAIGAVRYPGKTTFAGPSGRAVKYKMAGSFLWALLPSGRCLCYPYAKLKLRATPWGEEREAIHYMTVDSTSNKWVEDHTYGGKLVENNTQAICRDLLADALLRSEAADYPVVLHVHDEVVSEVPKGFGDLKEFESLCAKTPAWAAGLPVVAKGWRGERYRK